MKLEEQLNRCSVLGNGLIKNFSDVFDAGYPSLNKIKNELGEDTVLGFLKLHILDLRVFLNIGKTMSDTQTEQTAMLLFDEFPSLTVADIKLFFNKIKKGHYGQIYDRLDGQLILIWLAKYYNERLEDAENKSIRKHEELKKQKYVLDEDEVKNIYKKMQDGTYKVHDVVEEKNKKESEYLKVKAEYERNKLLSSRWITPTSQ